MKRLIGCVLILGMLLTGCGEAVGISETKQYTATFLDLFDTVTTIVGQAENEETFRAEAQKVHDKLLRYHQLFDIYNTYEGIANVKTINDQAGIAPVTADPAIIELLTDCREFYELSDHRLNVAMGSVLSLWHETRTEGIDDPQHAKLPEKEALEAASAHMSFDEVVIDEEQSAVYISDPLVQLDVGAVAKGWSAQKVAEESPSGLLLSVGGNVCATGPKLEDGTPWVIGIDNYDGSGEYLHTIYVTEGSVVTSGDYQRTYTVGGKAYHHIIDPQTLYPADRWHMVTVVCEDSGVADMLSTSLFLMSQEEGQKLLDQFDAEAVWVAMDEEIHYSPGFKDLIRT